MSAAVIPGWKHVYSGKVRDLYVPETSEPCAESQGPGSAIRSANAELVNPDVVLVVASDRISAYDFMLEPPIPGKGAILTALSNWWFDQLADLVPNHRVDPATLSAQDDEQANPSSCGDEVDRRIHPLVPAEFADRSMVCKRLKMFPVECVVRGYLTGSGLAEYRESGSVTGIQLPPGLTDGSRLPEPIFTPARKAEQGEHDENVPFEAIVDLVGAEAATELRRLSLEIYARAEKIARKKGVILADTKFEFGVDPATGAITLGDEVLTPDSSRFWALDEWQPGHAQPSFDKQYVRDWLTSPESGWDAASGQTPPELPSTVVEKTRARYQEALTRLTS